MEAKLFQDTEIHEIAYNGLHGKDILYVLISIVKYEDGHEDKTFQTRFRRR